MILESFLAFIRRTTDNVLPGRNRARIVVGTDRKNTVDSGYGDGGENDKESAAIDLVAGFKADSGNMSFTEDKTRLYLSAKSDPDDYIDNQKGETVTGEAVFLGVSDNVYLKSRKKTKILGPNYSILLDENGNCLIECDTKIEIKVGSNVVRLSSSGIELDAGQGPTGKIITDLDTCVGTDPVTGSPILSTFKRPESIVTNSKVVVK
jgi:hypothetical protein